MPSYHLTNKAIQDLEDIWNYTIEEWSENQADKYYFSLINSFNTIVNNPQIGKNYNQIKSNLLGHLHNQHIIFYIILPNKDVEIIRILHGRMDLNSKNIEQFYSTSSITNLINPYNKLYLPTIPKGN